MDKLDVPAYNQLGIQWTVYVAYFTDWLCEARLLAATAGV